MPSCMPWGLILIDNGVRICYTFVNLFKKENRKLKRAALFLLCLVMLLSLWGCGGADNYDVTINGTTYTVDTENKTILSRGHTYHYEYSGRPNNYEIKIYYPDGSWYFLEYIWDTDGGDTSGSYFSDNYQGHYADPEPLGAAVANGDPDYNPLEHLKKWVTVVGCIGLGLLGMLHADVAWELFNGWKSGRYPSEDSLVMTCVGGIVLIISGVIAIFVL